jgi:hypothetical protein
MRRAAALNSRVTNMTESREVIFISHANPEDNEFTMWLALKLTQCDYLVWTDLTGLLGGEDFWKEAEQVIRRSCVKFIYVLSGTSNQKSGPLQELNIARTVARRDEFSDFVIPLRIDKINYSDVNIELARINIIDFESSWYEGLTQLVAKLASAGVPHVDERGELRLQEWLGKEGTTSGKVVRVPEQVVSNIVQIVSTPKEVFYHPIRTQNSELRQALAASALPAFLHRNAIVTFADESALQQEPVLARYLCSFGRIPLGTRKIVSTQDVMRKDSQQRRHLTRLLTMAWTRYLHAKRLPIYEFSRRRISFYFTKGLAKGDRVPYTGPAGVGARRKVVGYRTVVRSRRESTRRWWHYGISLAPVYEPWFGYSVLSHVLFSYDGATIWESAKMLHKARRSQCRDWWNQHWRDRMLGALRWLSVSRDTICFPVGGSAKIEINPIPSCLEMPARYVGELTMDDTLSDDFEEESLDDN